MFPLGCAFFKTVPTMMNCPVVWSTEPCVSFYVTMAMRYLKWYFCLLFLLYLLGKVTSLSLLVPYFKCSTTYNYLSTTLLKCCLHRDKIKQSCSILIENRFLWQGIYERIFSEAEKSRKEHPCFKIGCELSIQGFSIEALANTMGGC